jgi:hypothetical protein
VEQGGEVHQPAQFRIRSGRRAAEERIRLCLCWYEVST